MSEIKDVLQEIGYSNITDGGKYYRMRPICRDSTNNSSLSVHKETGNFRDFSSNVVLLASGKKFTPNKKFFFFCVN